MAQEAIEYLEPKGQWLVSQLPLHGAGQSDPPGEIQPQFTREKALMLKAPQKKITQPYRERCPLTVKDGNL